MPGEHEVALHDPRYVSVKTPVRIADGEIRSVRFDPWLSAPTVRALHPSFPGATIDRADFLLDGQIAIGKVLPPGSDHQLWLLGLDGTMRQVSPRQSDGPLAVAANGKSVTFLVRRPTSSPGDEFRSEVWTSGLDGRGVERRYALATGEGHVVDLSWAPDAAHLLVVAHQSLAGGGGRTRFLWIGSGGGAANELGIIPSGVVPDRFTWTPDGRRVAFLTSTDSLASLCLLDIATGTFTYLADLACDDTSPLPFPPLAWSPDGERLIYAAPSSDRSGPTGWLLGGKPSTALFQASVGRPFGVRVGKAEGQAPAWREDDSVVALVPDRGGSLRVRLKHFS